MIERPDPYPIWLETIWAKSPEKGEGGEPESLAMHTWRVLARLSELIRLRPALPQRLGREDLWHLLYWAGFLHDFGKAHADFQGVLRKEKGAKERWGAHRHEVLSLPFLLWLSPSLEEEQTTWLIAAIVSHHKEAGELRELYPLFEPYEEDDPLSDLLLPFPEETLQGLWRWLDACGNAWIEQLALPAAQIQPLSLLPLQQAIRSFREQGLSFIQRSLRQFQHFVRSLEDSPAFSHQMAAITLLRGYLLQADHSASAHVESLPPLQLQPQGLLRKRNLDSQDLYPHQRQAAQQLGSAMLIAPTGSGKTEAALLWAANQPNAGRLFYALPYQASMNAMKRRLSDLFGEFTVGLQHGRGLLALYRNLMERDYSPEQAARTARWMKNLAELNIPPIRVFSPYQMLKAIYRLKGYEAQLADYFQALFVLDEIHAYEVSRLALILKTVEYLHQTYHSRFLIMSATFPSLIRNWIAEAVEEIALITAEPQVYRRFQRHLLHYQEGDLLEQLPRVRAELEKGNSVLVVCNTVARAQQAYHTLKAWLPDSGRILLLHGRFNQRDRLAKEKRIQELFGSQSRQPTALALVSTQAVEVSLDIDLDILFSDPAPLEALVQRFGRVNRSGRKGSTAPVYVFSQPADGQRVYDAELIHRTLSLLRSYDKNAIQEDRINAWLDEIYADSVALRWEEQYRQAAREFDLACLQTLRPFRSIRMLENQFYRLFDGIEVLPISLYDQYQQNLEEQPITAEELLVPLRWGQYHMLANQGLILPGDRHFPPVVKTTYTSETGLTFDALTFEDEWD